MSVMRPRSIPGRAVAKRSRPAASGARATSAGHAEGRASEGAPRGEVSASLTAAGASATIALVEPAQARRKQPQRDQRLAGEPPDGSASAAHPADQGHRQAQDDDRGGQLN